ncbi:MAG: beta-xylosidase [Verrucomicrobia bacterium]|nr:beta-xylosidase [Verrucomicrobiota bacterium]
MVEAVAFWNEPNNKSHWDFQVDPGWDKFCQMVRLASAAVRKANPDLLQVLGGMSPIDPTFIELLASKGVVEGLDALAVHGFPLDWNHWQINEWPDKLRSIQSVSDLPVWITEIGASTFGAEEVQVFGLQRSAELLGGLAPRIHWYSLFDLPKAWPATTRHREAEGSAYYRHFYMGLVKEDGTEKLAYPYFARLTPEFGLCQWFHFRDHRLQDAVRRFTDLGVGYIRTGLSWADRFRPDALAWFDEQMAALEPFKVTVTFCFTPEELGIAPHHTSAPRYPERFAEFCTEMVERYAPASFVAEKVGPSSAGTLWS